MRQAGLASQAPDLGHLRALYTATWAAPEATISAAASVAVTWPAWADNISFVRRGFYDYGDGCPYYTPDALPSYSDTSGSRWLAASAIHPDSRHRGHNQRPAAAD
jgi:hypothetical protein